MSADMSWQLRGACRTDPEMFFHPDGERDAPKRRRIANAKAKCRACPVLDRCQTYALDNREEYGIWGALSEAEREEIRAGKTIGPAPELYVAPVRVEGATVDPGPIAEHVRRLQAAGFTLVDIAQFAGITVWGLRPLLNGDRKRTYAATAQRILSVQVREVAA